MNEIDALEAGAKVMTVITFAFAFWVCGYVLGTYIGRSQVCATTCGEHYVVQKTTCVCLEVVP